MDMAAIALAVVLGLLAAVQWRDAAAFAADARSTTGTVVELRTAKKVLLDPHAEVFATVEFTTADGEVTRAEIPDSVQSLGLDPAALEGMRLPISYDPASVRRVRYGSSTGHESVLILALLAVGALFAPMILRQSSLRTAGSAGGG